MNYWEGFMNWPLNPDWKCQTCGEHAGLTWGMVHAECRCNACHTQYYMRDENKQMVDMPVCMLKDEYKEPAKQLWGKLHTHMSEWTDEDWDSIMQPKEQS